MLERTYGIRAENEQAIPDILDSNGRVPASEMEIATVPTSPQTARENPDDEWPAIHDGQIFTCPRD